MQHHTITSPPTVRSLKIQPKTRVNRYHVREVPEIRLSGEWLARLGFRHGQRVTITTRHHELVIRVQQE